VGAAKKLKFMALCGRLYKVLKYRLLNDYAAGTDIIILDNSSKKSQKNVQTCSSYA